MKELTIRTPAKINIGLNILSKREDGFHNLETIYYPINLFDELTIRENIKFELITNNSLLNSEKGNTIIKARELISHYTGIDINASITLNKNIPMGAGMGGGSSDGSAALIIFNRYYDLKLTNEELFDLALKIGSDAPFFIDPKPKFASSRGEIFEFTELMINKPILIINPGIHISTTWAFSKITPKMPGYHLNQIEFKEHNSLSGYKNTIINDFESIVFEIFPEVKGIKDKMYELGAEFSLMTGSGSTVFGIFPDKPSALEASFKFPSNYFTFLNS